MTQELLIEDQHQTMDLFGYVPDQNKQASKTKKDPPIKTPLEKIPNFGREVVKLNSIRAKSLAKEMWQRFILDLNSMSAIRDNSTIMGGQWTKKELIDIDLLIWVYGFNPDGAELSFEWVCDNLRLDHEAIRSIIGRNKKKELKVVISVLASFISYQHAKSCEMVLLEYGINVAGWDFH